MLLEFCLVVWKTSLCTLYKISGRIPAQGRLHHSIWNWGSQTMLWPVTKWKKSFPMFPQRVTSVSSEADSINRKILVSQRQPVKARLQENIDNIFQLTPPLKLSWPTFTKPELNFLKNRPLDYYIKLFHDMVEMTYFFFLYSHLFPSFAPFN